MLKNMKQGFTLLELSIVLVIIGLIIGGITAGQELIRSAELNSVVSDVNKYKVAVNTFKLKYNALPGDMDNASSYWPTCVDDGAVNTCNGDGDGIIEPSNAWGGYTKTREVIRAWQHLSLADMISGNFTGEDNFCESNFYCNSFNTNPIILPQGQLNQFYQIYGENGKLVIDTFTAAAGTSRNFYYVYGNTKVSASYSNSSGYVTGAEAYNLDTKYDDGIAHKGALLSSLIVSCGDLNGNYILSSSSSICVLTFMATGSVR